MENSKFGSLTIVEFYEKDRKSHYFWRCVCDCGKWKIIREDSLTSGKTISCGCSRKQREEVRLIRRVLVNYKKSAKKRDILFELAECDFRDLIFNPCEYCGSPPENKMSGFVGKYQGIDRIDSSLGYFWDNVVPCCGKCNAQKNNNDSTFLNKIK